MTIKVYNSFSKRNNSTKQPTGGTDVSVVLKTPTSIMHPVFEVSTSYASTKYVYVAAWSRYYFVDDVVYLMNDIIELHCVVDPMASFKSNVGAVSTLIEYTSSSTNILLPDPRNRPKCDIIEQKSDLLDLSNAGFGGGIFILGVAGGNGGVTYYEMDALKLKAVMDEVYDTNFWQALENQFYDITSCIVSCILVPGLPEPETGTDTIYVAGQPLTVSATRINRYKTIAETSYDVKFPFGDGIWAEGSENYVDFEYSVGNIYLPFVGVVPLDVSIVAHSRQIRLGAEIDWYCGAIVYKLANASGDYIGTYEGRFGTDVPIVAQTYNPMGVASGIIGMIGSAAASVGSPAGIAGLAGSAAYTISQLAMHTQVNGRISSAMGNRLGLKAVATVITRSPAEPDLRQFQSALGMPFFQVSLVSALSGYVKCFGASVSIDGTDAERSMINNYMNSGFYYE